MKYYPYGDCRNSVSEIPTDRLFTGQRYDDTGLYYYGARYYDPEIGRFISPDTIIPNPADPQSFNRYAYCLNNPLRYVDPTGHFTEDELKQMGITKNDTPSATYSLLREAKVGDQLVVDKSDGTRAIYTFTENSEYNFYSPYDDISLQSNDNQYIGISAVVNDENNDILTLCEKRPTLIQNSDYTFSTKDEYYIDMVISPPNYIASPLESQPYQGTNPIYSANQIIGGTKILVGLVVIGSAGYMILTGPIGIATLGFISFAELGYAYVDSGVNVASEGKEDLPDIPYMWYP